MTTIEATLLDMNIKESHTTPLSTDPSGPAEYEDYDSTSVNYDDTRVPVGLPIILDFLASTPKPLDEQSNSRRGLWDR